MSILTRDEQINELKKFHNECTYHNPWSMFFHLDFDQLEVAFKPVIEWINEHPDQLI